jgi:hypothetical protein
MYTITHRLIETHTGEPVKITFTVTDQAGAPVTVASATAVYKIARRLGEAALLTKTDADGITLSGSTAIVEFNTGELVDDDEVPLLGDFAGQLLITKDGDGLIVAEGQINIAPVIL